MGGTLYMNLQLSDIRNSKDLARYIPISEELLVLYADESYKDSFIKIVKIKKYAHKFREVLLHDDITYGIILKAFSKYFSSLYLCPKSVFGYVKQGGIAKNASMHLNRNKIMKCDINNFFYSITQDGIQKKLLEYGANSEISLLLSQLTTYHNILFPGLNTSPVLSNMYCEDLDKSLTFLSDKYGCIYTRYADDITISSDYELPTKDELINIIKQNGFSINEKKYKIMRKGRYQVVTGLTVFDKKRPRIPREIKKRIRLACFLLSKTNNPIEYSLKVKWCKYNYLHDVLKYYRTIEPEFVQKMLYLTKGKIDLNNRTYF